MSGEHCLIHGTVKQYDMRSGFDLCQECEEVVSDKKESVPTKLETGVMYEATVNGEEGKVMFFTEEAAAAYSRPPVNALLPCPINYPER